MDWRGASIEARYTAISAIQEQVTTEMGAPGETLSDKLDRVLTHKIWGTLIFRRDHGADVPEHLHLRAIADGRAAGGVDGSAARVGAMMPPGDLNSLLVDGVIAGVGAVVVFLPQILLLFLVHRLAGRHRLHGARGVSHGPADEQGRPARQKLHPDAQFVRLRHPRHHGHAHHRIPKDRLVTILVAPLMSCSARLPVYTLLIAACIPEQRSLRLPWLDGLTMLAMYLLGIVVALLMAWLFQEDVAQGRNADAHHGVAALQTARCCKGRRCGTCGIAPKYFSAAPAR